MQDYDAALALMPSNVNALLRKGQVLQALGKPAVSIKMPLNVCVDAGQHCSSLQPILFGGDFSTL
jgi:hypothetical protein